VAELLGYYGRQAAGQQPPDTPVESSAALASGSRSGGGSPSSSPQVPSPVLARRELLAAAAAAGRGGHGALKPLAFPSLPPMQQQQQPEPEPEPEPGGHGGGHDELRNLGSLSRRLSSLEGQLNAAVAARAEAEAGQRGATEQLTQARTELASIQRERDIYQEAHVMLSERCVHIEAPWLVIGGHGASLRHFPLLETGYRRRHATCDGPCTDDHHRVQQSQPHSGFHDPCGEPAFSRAAV
jgi:hypothetical protein